MSSPRAYDVRAWVVWVAAGGLLVLLGRNPLYLVLLLAVSRAVHSVCEPRPLATWRLPFGRIAILILTFSTLFNMLTAHIGSTVLVTLPANWWLIGGPITLEAAVYGLIAGLTLVTLLSFFLAFNTIVPTHELAGLTPGALYELGLVLLIALTYVPETGRQFRRIREAQAIRGHRLRGLRDWRPILIPLLIGSLERAMNLAETMVARGYGATEQSAAPLRTRLLLAGGLVAALAGLLRLAWGGTDGWALLALAALAIGLGYRAMSRGTPRTRYRPRRWTGADSVVAAAAVVALAVGLVLGGVAGAGYSPYPQLAWPPVNPWLGVGLLGLAVPAVLEVTR